MLVSEPIVHYLGESQRKMSTAFLSQLARTGLYGKHVTRIKSKTGFDLYTLARILQVTPRTLQNKSDSDSLSITVSEKILALARLFLRGNEVFGNEIVFKKWLESPLPALENQTPLSLLDTMFGFEEIEQLLGRIEHGVLS